MKKIAQYNGIIKHLKKNGVALISVERKVKLNLKHNLEYAEYVREYTRLSKLFERKVKRYIYEHYPNWKESEYILITTFNENLIRSELMTKKDNMPEGIEECLKDAVNRLEMPSYE